MINIYGIKACDTCRKALKWLEAEGREHRWQDIREQPLDESTLSDWVERLGPDTLVNRRSTTWRGLDQSARDQAMDSARSTALLLAHPTLIKRPIFERGDELMVGFNAAVRQAL